MKNMIKSIALASIFTMVANAEHAEQQPQKSAMEQHEEAIEAQTKRWMEATKDGVPSQERMAEIIASNRRIIQDIWAKEAERQANARNQ